MRPIFAIWIYWGAELRAFVFSGLARELARHGDLYVVSRVDPRELAPTCLPAGCRVLSAPAIRYPRGFAQLHSFANLAHGEWISRRYAGLAIRDQAAIGEPGENGAKRLRRRAGGILARSAMVRLLNRRLLRWGRKLAAVSGTLATEIPWCREGTLLTGDYLGVPGHLFAQTAMAAGWRVCFYPLNWRDISKGARIALPVTNLAVWDAPMKNLLFRNNPWLRKLPCRVVGSTQFDSHFRDDWILDRRDFCQSLSIDPDRQIVCYSGVSDRAYQGEAAIVGLLAREIQAAGWADRLQILVRLNPTASDPAYREMAARWSPLVKLLAPEWDLRFADGSQPVWRSNTETDARLLANLIRHTAVHVCLPSTMVLDFGVRGVPTVGIAFDADEPAGRRSLARDFAAQEIVRGAVAAGATRVADSPRTAVAGIVEALAADAGARARLTGYVRDLVGAVPGTAHAALAAGMVADAEAPRCPR